MGIVDGERPDAVRSGTVIRGGLPLDQASYEFLCEVLRGVLRDGVLAGPGPGEGIGSLRCRVSGALYALLSAHPVDRRGRCRSCRRWGAVLGRRRRLCWVNIHAGFWLRQPEWFLHSRVAAECGLVDLSPAAAPGRASATGPADPAVTDMLPRTAAQAGDPSTPPFQTPVIPPPLPSPQVPPGRGGRTLLTAGQGLHTRWPPASPCSIPLPAPGPLG